MVERRQKLLDYYRKNPPHTKADIDAILAKHELDKEWLDMALCALLPDLINYNRFTKSDFEGAIRTIIEREGDDSAAVAGEFLFFCEPFFERHTDYYKGLKKIPKPYKEILAAYHFWGVISSDGLISYCDNYSKNFDAIASEGLLLLNFPKSASFLETARNSWSPKDYHFGNLDIDDIEDQILDECDEFERALVIKLKQGIK